MIRCAWVPQGDELYEKYHDEEWGVPSRDDARMFEFVVLESAQAGLSWRTILGRRAGYRKAFAGFDVYQVSLFTDADVERLTQDAGIIRNRQKIVAAIKNAQAFIDIQQEFGSFSTYIWRFVDNTTIDGARQTIKNIPAQTPESVALAKDLKRRGFSFFGPIVCYSHMQALGLVNDHTIDCHRYHV